MTCRELEQLLGTKPLSAEARAHLASCDSCKVIAQWFEGANEKMPPTPRIEVPALRPARPLPSPWWIAISLLLAGALALAVGVQKLGVAGWNSLEAFQKIPIFAGLAIAGAAASLLLAREMFPSLQRRIHAPVCVAAAVAAIIAGPIALLPLEYDPDGFTDLGMNCAKYGLICASGCFVLLYRVIRRGYFLRPGWAGTLAGLVSGVAALTVLEVYCPLIERSHVLAWHVSVTLVSMLISSAFVYLATKLSTRNFSRT